MLNDFVPGFYQELRKYKFMGDKKMNEILLKQINIFQQRLIDTTSSADKHKSKYSDLHSDVQQRDSYFAELRQDCITDALNLYALQRKMKFVDAEFDRQDQISEDRHKLERTVPSQIETHKLGQRSVEEYEAQQRADEIMSRLRERLEATALKDLDMQKLIERLPVV